MSPIPDLGKYFVTLAALKMQRTEHGILEEILRGLCVAAGLNHISLCFTSFWQLTWKMCSEMCFYEGRKPFCLSGTHSAMPSAPPALGVGVVGGQSSCTDVLSQLLHNTCCKIS